jgi:hypothetical protein
LDDYKIKYLIKYNNISPTETEVIISLLEEPSIIIYKFRDKLIVLPKLEKNEILFERIIISKNKSIYIIDLYSKEILLVKNKDINKSKGIINKLNLDLTLTKDDLNKFITFDIESVTDLDSLKQDGDQVYFDPILITAYDFYKKNSFKKFLRTVDDIRIADSIPISSKNGFELNLRTGRLDKLNEFFLQFIDKNYHKFRLYAHNLSSYDGILILEALFQMYEDCGFKIEPVIRENKIISLKLRFGKTKENKFRYYIKFHDSLLILLDSLPKLSNSFLSDHPILQKMNDQKFKNLLLYKENRNKEDLQESLQDLMLYCERDSICLANIISIFAEIIFEKYKINVHKCPTASSLAMKIYLTHFLESDELIPLISGEIYRNIKKAYHGGHTDVYKLYSNKPVHSYDYVSMYPTQMMNQYMPVGKITRFIGNPLLTGETLESLSKQLAFVKCSIYVDKSLNRPVYQTLININGQLRSMCATGTFLNQMVFVPELLEYEKKN